MNDHLYAVIMAGGVGSRLWPRSRGSTPKQFHDLVSARTMLQETVDRIEPLIPPERLLVVVGEAHAGTVRSQIPSLPAENLVLEPGPRDTAPAIGLAAVALQQRDPQATMAVFPADHCIGDAEGFRQAVAAAARIAGDGYLVTLGITPSHAHTGYGYIQRGEELEAVNGLSAFRVQRFAEKPDEATARRFVASGEYYWNAGMFIWQTSRILSEMACQLPDLYAELETVAKAWDSPRRRELLAASWDRISRVSIDYGVMENASQVAVVPADIGWNDVGNWATLSTLLDSDQAGNVLRGPGRHLPVDTEGTYIYAWAGRLVAVIGLQDFVIVDTPDALLVCPKDRAQDVRQVVKQLEADGLQEYL